MRLDNLALKFERFLEVLCGILLGVIVAIVAYQVFGRYVLNRSPS